MSTAVAANPIKQRFEVVKTFLTGDDFKKQLALHLPRHIKPDHLIRIALTSVMRNPKLAECTQASLVQCLYDCGSLGLDPGGPLGDAHLIPFNNRRANRVDCQLIVGYQGLVRLVRNTNELASVAAHVIYERDEFMVVLGDDEHIDHKPYWGEDSERGAMVGAYAIAKFKNGGIQRAIMTRNQIDAIMRRSKSSHKDDSPWKTDYDEMAKKTVLRRLCKLLPKSAELQKALDLDADNFADPLSATLLEDPNLLDTTAGQAEIETETEEETKPQGKLSQFTEQLKTTPQATTTKTEPAAKTETTPAKETPAKRTRKPPAKKEEKPVQDMTDFFEEPPQDEPDDIPEESEVVDDVPEDEESQETPGVDETQEPEEEAGGELATPGQLSFIDAALDEMKFGPDKIQGVLDHMNVKRFSDMTEPAARVFIESILEPRLKRFRAGKT